MKLSLKINVFVLTFIILQIACSVAPEEDFAFCNSAINAIPSFITTNCEGLEDEEAQTCTQNEMLAHISSTLEYPQEAIDDNIEGTVKVAFTVDLQGNPTNLEITKSIGFGCDEEAIRIINTLKFIPGKNRCDDDTLVNMEVPVEFSR